MPTEKQVFATSAPVQIQAAEGDDKKGPPTFDVVAYTGVAMDIQGWEFPVVIDLEGLEYGKSIVANLDHESRQRVGHVTEREIEESELRLKGLASAATPYRDEVVNSSAEGFIWQASVEVSPVTIEEVPAGQTAEANGKQFTGPAFITRKGILSGFAFVSHGADDSTKAKIAAKAGTLKEKKTMNPELKAFIEAKLPGIDIEALSADAIANLQADFDGKDGVRSKKTTKLHDMAAEKQAEVQRVDAITQIALKACDNRPYDIEAIQGLGQEAIDGKWSIEKFRLELLEASVPPAGNIFIHGPKPGRHNAKVIEAAICMAGRLTNYEKQYDDQTLQAAHDQFRNGIGLKELLVLSAQANGYSGGSGYNVDIDVQRAAFAMQGPRQLASSFSTFSLPTTLSNVANKFLRQGWMKVDQTPLRIAGIKNVSDFKEVTTVSLTGGMQFQQVGKDGELKHGSVGEETYGNKADTFGIIFSITRQDIINDDLSALTAVPRRIGRGGMLKLNNIFWTAFLNNSDFFKSANNNVSTGGDSALGLDGLKAAEQKFLVQTDPDGEPLGAMPTILLVPPTLKSTALTLMNSQLTITGASATLPDGNIWNGRFQVESSAYMENSSYTGNSTAAWYLLADPEDVPVIEIAALNGRVEPTVETADADFNVLGIQMRGYSDVGVRKQEFRGGVRSAGS